MFQIVQVGAIAKRGDPWFDPLWNTSLVFYYVIFSNKYFKPFTKNIIKFEIEKSLNVSIIEPF